MNFLKPPQTVIYTNDMEPITIVKMEPSYWDFLDKHKRICFPVLNPVNCSASVDSNFANYEFYSAEIHAHKLIRSDGSKYYMLTTTDEEIALLLKSTFLPGQQSALLEERKNAFARGFLKALSMTGEI